MAYITKIGVVTAPATVARIAFVSRLEPSMPDRGSARRRPSRRRVRSFARGPDRLPPLPASELSEAQKAAAAEIAAGPRGTVVGPFIAALRSPELMSRLQRLGEYLRYENALGPRLTELAILITARAWTQQLEWALHVDAAKERGIARATIAAIARGKRPARMADDEAVVHDFLRELHETQAVSDPTYARALAALGERGVVDLTTLAGYYTTLAMILNVARTPLPRGKRAAHRPWRATRRRARR
jgi:4-carboxymuconolactone decarboxylase